MIYRLLDLKLPPPNSSRYLLTRSDEGSRAHSSSPCRPLVFLERMVHMLLSVHTAPVL